MKKLINVLWAIEKDLRVIASNTEAISQIRNDNKPISIEKLVGKNAYSSDKARL